MNYSELTDNVRQVQDLAVNEFDGVFERSNLTRLQFLYWISQRLRPSAPFLNTILTFSIDGPVNIGHFQNAFQEVIRQSDALRTVIKEINGVPQRKVIPDFPSKLGFIDLSKQSDSSEALDTWLADRASYPLKIDQCLFDAALLKISSQRYVWYLNQHHINADASSFFLIFGRLAKVYESLLSGKAFNKPEMPTFESYVDYERKYRQSSQFVKASSYWKDKLIPGPEPLKFFGRSPYKRSTCVERISYDLGRERSQKIRHMVRQEGIYSVSEEYSLYNLFAALFFILLHQLSGNRRLGFITPVHNRFTESFRNTVGLVMELCPLQIEVSEKDTFLSLVNKVKRETRETMGYYQAGSSISLQNKGFDAMFNVHPMPDFRLNGASVTLERTHPGHGTEALALYVNDDGTTGNLLLHFDFHADVFAREERIRSVQSFAHLVDLFLQNSLLPISSMHVLRRKVKSDKSLPVLADISSHTSPSENPEFVAPRDQIEYQLLKIWEELLGISPISMKADFFELGGSSWLATRLFFLINKVMSKNLPLSTMLEVTTIEEMANLIRTRTEAELWSSIVRLQPEGENPPFFFIPGAGGNLLRLADLARFIGPIKPFYAFQIPGFDGKQQPFASIEEVANYLIGILRSIQPAGPYILGGYSWGATVALEMAQQLQTEGQEIVMLAIVDTTVKSPLFKHLRRFTQGLRKILHLEQKQEEDLFLVLYDFLFELNLFIRRGYREKAMSFYYRTRRSIKEKIFNRETPSIPNLAPKKVDYWESFNLDPLRLKMIRINARSKKVYVPREYHGRVLFFKSIEGDRNPNSRSTDPTLGWENVATEGVDVHLIPGNHLSMMDEPNVITLATHLRKNLMNVQHNIANFQVN